MRFYDVDKGNQDRWHRYSSVETRRITAKLRNGLAGYVALDASLRENLQYGNDTATDEEIYDALKHAYMYEYVMRLPETLDTPIGHQGIKI